MTVNTVEPQIASPAVVTPPRGVHVDMPNPKRLMSRFNIAFSLMSLIPLLTCFYLITVKLFTISILQGLNGVYFLLALVIALLGLLAGHQLIREIIRHLIETNAKLERLYSQQAGFVSNVAHEFRSPLMIFRGALDNLADGLHGPLTPDQQEPVTMCQKEISRLSRLVGDLLDVARIESGKLRLSQEPVVLQDLLQSVVQLFSGPMKERGLRLTMDLPEQPVEIRGDWDRLKQVFVNLLSNAIKYTQAGGVHVRLTRIDDALQVEVEDTGEGIAREDLERIFDKFERVGSQSEDGSGLGLPIAKDLVELHHGRLWAESQLGRGSRFIVRLSVTGVGSA